MYSVKYILERMFVMKIFSKVFKISAFLIFSLACLTSCSSSTQESEEVLKVGMECSYAPFNWIQPTDKNGAVKISDGWYACGYDVYIAKEISKKLGKSVRLVDAAEVLAEEVQTRLTNTHQLNKKGRGSLKIYASDAPSRFKRLAKHILGRELKQVYLKKLN